MSDTEDDSSTSENSWPIHEPWIEDVLKIKHKIGSQIKILDHSVKPTCHNGVSNLSDLISVSIEYQLMNGDDRDHSGPYHSDLIIKLLPHDPFSRHFVTEAQFDLREINFYTKILPDLVNFQKTYLRSNQNPLTISVPTCFYTQYTAGLEHETTLDGHLNPEPPESILVLDDMRRLGYHAAYFTKGLTLSEAECAIKAIAVVHALTLGMKIKKKFNLTKKYPFLFHTIKATESYQKLIEQGMPQLIRFLEKCDTYESELIALNRIRNKTRTIIESLLQPDEPMGLITHTDFWCNNLMFKTIENEDLSEDNRLENCIILDWQMITYSRPTNDIALLIISSLPSKVRRENTDKLLDIYYENFRGNLSMIDVDLEVELEYSREKLSDDYKKSLLLAILLCIGSVDIALGNADVEQRFLDVLKDLYEMGIFNYENIINE